MGNFEERGLSVLIGHHPEDSGKAPLDVVSAQFRQVHVRDGPIQIQRVLAVQNVEEESCKRIEVHRCLRDGEDGAVPAHHTLSLIHISVFRLPVRGRASVPRGRRRTRRTSPLRKAP